MIVLPFLMSPTSVLSSLAVVTFRFANSIMSGWTRIFGRFSWSFGSWFLLNVRYHIFRTPFSAPSGGAIHTAPALMDVSVLGSTVGVGVICLVSGAVGTTCGITAGAGEADASEKKRRLALLAASATADAA